MKNILFLDSAGHVTVAMLRDQRCAASIEYAHLITDNPSAKTAAYDTGNLNDDTPDVLDTSIERVACQYAITDRGFPFVILTEINPRDDNETAIKEWNILLEAAQPMLDVADTLIICVTQREIDSDLLVSPDKAVVVKDTEGAIQAFLDFAIL